MYRNRIELSELEPGMIVAEDLYVMTESGTNMLLVNEDTVVTDKIISILNRQNTKNQNVKSLVIFSKTPPVELTVNEEKDTEPKVIPIVPDDLVSETVESIKNLFLGINESAGQSDADNMTTAYRAIQNFDKVVNQLVTVVSSEPNGVIHINNLKRYDEYTYHHSVSVAVLSATIGRSLGFGFTERVRLSRCAILHDLGKLTIPIDILNSPGKLSDDQFKVMKNHAINSCKYLKNHAFGNAELWNGVMCHHEKINGKGYPRGLAGNDIPLFSRIIAVADVYDAVTSYRSYRNPMTPSDAYELVMKNVGTDFQHDIVEAFLEKLILYPINTALELSDGRECYVTENENPLRPVVKIKGTAEKVDLSDPRNYNIAISKVIMDTNKRDSASAQPA